MATLGATNLTLADWAKRKDPNGKTAQIVEMLSQTNEILQDMVFIEGNLPTGHRTTIRTGLPTVYWRLLNQGVLGSKSTTAQVDEACGLLEAWSEQDVELAKLGGDAAAFRLSEAAAFIEAMGQEMGQTVFYGNSGTAPEEFTGLSTRYSSLSAANAQNIVTGGGSGSDNSSVWLIVWGDRTVHGTFPKGSKAGLEHNDHGETTSNNHGGTTGAKLRVYQDQFTWKAGLVLKDWRYAVRVCNIDISNLIAKSSAADLFDKMIKATHRVPNLKAGRAAFYMNRTVNQELDIQKRDDVVSGGQLTYSDADGKPVMSFRGIPIRTCDALLETEATVS
jgi:hypothetical protein